MTTEELTIDIGGAASLEPGTYEATLIGLEHFEYDDGEAPKTLRRWTFGTDELDPATGEPISIDGVSSLARGPKSKSYLWLTALLGKAPEPGKFTASSLIGRPCMITVELNEAGYSKVVAVVPPPKRKPAPVAEATADALPF